MDSQLRLRVLSAVRPALGVARCELLAFDMAREASNETVEQDDSEMLRLSSNLGGVGTASETATELLWVHSWSTYQRMFCGAHISNGK